MTPRTPPPPAETAASRLQRLLTMVPWLLGRDGIRVEDAARALGVSVQQVDADLSLLFVCGLPRRGPEDLIEAYTEGGAVHVSNADAIARPLRLTPDEATALIVALRAMRPVLGEGDDTAVVDGLLAKLTAAAGEAAAAAARVHVDAVGEAAEALVPPLRAAIATGRAIRIGYHVPSRDEVTSRVVDPQRLFTEAGHTYLDGWCHEARAGRRFRVDRVTSLAVLDEPVRERPGPSAAVPDSVRSPQPDDLPVRLRLAPGAAWVADYYPMTDVVTQPDGSVEATLAVHDPQWVVRLVWRLGGDAGVLAPEDVREQVRSGMVHALDTYSA